MLRFTCTWTVLVQAPTNAGIRGTIFTSHQLPVSDFMRRGVRVGISIHICHFFCNWVMWRCGHCMNGSCAHIFMPMWFLQFNISKRNRKIDRCRWTITCAMRHSPYNNTRCLNTLHYDIWNSSLTYFQTDIMFTINNVNILQAKSLLVRTCKMYKRNTHNSTNAVFSDEMWGNLL